LIDFKWSSDKMKKSTKPKSTITFFQEAIEEETKKKYDQNAGVQKLFVLELFNTPFSSSKHQDVELMKTFNISLEKMIQAVNTKNDYYRSQVLSTGNDNPAKPNMRY
jgi:hypothetical protein